MVDAQKVDFYVKSWPFPTRVSHRSLIDPKGRSAWLTCDGESPVDRPRGLGQCVWQAHGVWTWDEQKKSATILQRDYFDYDHRSDRHDKIEWYCDCYSPFLQKFAERVSRKQHFSFIEPIPNEFPPPLLFPEDSEPKPTHTLLSGHTTAPRNLVYAPHFYDLNVLFSKSYSWMSVNVQGLSRGMFILKALYFGARGLRKNYKKQIGTIVARGRESLGDGVPVLIGEVGIPFDINARESFTTGRYDKQRQLMDGLIGAMEDNMVGFTLWNYNPANTFEYGDGWNKEDFSIINCEETAGKVPVYSDYRNKSHEDDELYRGGRTLDVLIRPYAVKTAGKPIRSHWDCETLQYNYEWSSVASEEIGERLAKSFLTEIFVPAYHYDKNISVKVSNGRWSFDKERQTLYVWHDDLSKDDNRHRLVLCPEI